MGIPQFEESSGVLPPGDHEATLADVSERFCWNYSRRRLYIGLEYVAGELISHQVEKIWVDGSFTTRKERPKDVDVVYEIPPDVNIDEWGWLSPGRRRDLKKIHRVDLLADHPGKPNFYNLFCQNKDDGTPKGIIRLITDAA